MNFNKNNLVDKKTRDIKLGVETDADIEKELELLESNKAIIDIKLSLEQELITTTKCNIMVDAVAGSGKTTTILHLALRYPDSNIIQITYNNMLKREVRKKVDRLAIKNMTIHTYHSLAVKYYQESAYTDEEIKKILINNTPMKTKISPIDILLIDETQDMAQDYYNLVRKFISDTKSNPQIVIMGDRYQSIYEFKGANSKFLTLADKLWNCDFEKMNLTTSYRLTNQIAWFVNKVMLGNDRIDTVKSGPPVDYYIGNSYQIYKKLGKQLRKLMKDDGIKEQDIFILSPSVKSLEPPFKKLENYLVKKGHKCTTPSSDDAKLDEKVISNKIVFTTFHQAKGRERKVVVLYNFDDSFTQFFLKPTDPVSTCPNILYVGATRASYKLIVIQDNKYKPLNFLSTRYLKKSENLNVITVNEQNLDCINLLNKPREIKKISTTDLIKFISSGTIDKILNILGTEYSDSGTDLFIQLRKPNNLVDIPNKIKNITVSNGNEIVTFEDVSDLNGLVIPAIYEKLLLKKNSTIEDYVLEQIRDNNPLITDLKKYISKTKIPSNDPKNFLRIGNLYLALQSKLLAKITQIKKYDWLDLNMILKCHTNMTMISDTSIKFEVPIINDELDNSFVYEHKEFGPIHLTSRLDGLDSKTIWEFKCVDNLSIDHKLQIIIYAWAYHNSMEENLGPRDFILLNVKSGEMLKLKFNIDSINQIVELLFNDKYSIKKELNDDEFVNMINQYKKIE